MVKLYKARKCGLYITCATTSMTYNCVYMEIIETSVFTRKIRELISDEEYGELQFALIQRPDTGAVIPLFHYKAEAYEKYVGQVQVGANGVVSGLFTTGMLTSSRFICY